MESFYPQLHFSTFDQWMNDPNGMVKIRDEYHLFYQASPEGSEWGDIGWGHAISRDLVSWEQKPNALHATASTMCFSGSAIELNDTIVAFYTACTYEWRGDEFCVLSQTQRAVSYDENIDAFQELYQDPVLDIGSTEFRDPKVIQVSDSQWLMLVARSRDFIIEFYQSEDLKNWHKVSQFSDCNLRSGAWECPDLVKVKSLSEEKWVMLLSVDFGTRSGSSGMIYMIGDLQGNCFVKDTRAMNGADFFWFDYGPDIFAGQSFYTADDSPPIVIAWLNSWKYAKNFPRYGLPQMQSLPRSLSLVQIDNGLRVAQTIPNSIAMKAPYFDYRMEQKEELVIPSTSILRVQLSENFSTCLEFVLSKQNTILLTHDVDKRTLLIERVDATQRLTACEVSYLCPLCTDSQELFVYFDKASVEFFADGGAMACSFRTSELFTEVVTKHYDSQY